MCCHIRADPIDRISQDPSKDLSELLDSQMSINNGCNYINPEDIKIEEISNSGQQLSILHINIHSIPSKLDNLKSLLNALRNKKIMIDVILICETFITDNNKDSCEIEGYKLFEEHRKLITRGGVAVYVSKNIKFRDRSDLNIFEEGVFESCFIEITSRPKNIIIGEIYRVPGTNKQDFISKYEKIITVAKAERKNLIIGTDQNLDYLKVHTHSNTAKFLDLNLSNDLLPTINKPTRITHRACTLIDNIYIPSTLSNNLLSMILVTDISDHLPCLTILKGTSNELKEPVTTEYRKLDDHNITRIKNALKPMDWGQLENLDANKGYDLLVERITSVMDIIAPVQQKTIKPKIYNKGTMDVFRTYAIFEKM